MKVAPLLRAFSARPEFTARLVHTGQHYDAKLSQVFFEELGIPRPDTDLGVGSHSHAVQTAEVMSRFEPVLLREQAQVVLVVGDVNSTVACALVAVKTRLEEPFATRWGLRQRPLVVHVEAGLRSFDPDMPEEHNRKLTDCLSDVLYVSDPAGLINLAREGVPEERVVLVGNVMIDTLLAARDRARQSRVLEGLGLEPGRYGVVTLHRPSNVDDVDGLGALLSTLDVLSHDLPLVFPVHPRTRTRLENGKCRLDPSRWHLTDPLGYFDFVRLLGSASVVLTDSGGIQEETTVLGVPCITLRHNTERPCTVEEGTNQLVGTARESILSAYARVSAGEIRGRIPRFWDGKAAERIVDHLATLFASAPA